MIIASEIGYGFLKRAAIIRRLQEAARRRGIPVPWGISSYGQILPNAVPGRTVPGRRRRRGVCPDLRKCLEKCIKLPPIGIKACVVGCLKAAPAR